MSDFWEKVNKCKHENIYPCYYEDVGCPTPYCSGGESHCMDCGVYIQECMCGYCCGMSGWPIAKHRSQRKKRLASLGIS